MNQPCFRPENTDLIGLFRRLGPSLVRIGGHSGDQTRWNPNGAGLTRGQVAPRDIDALAGFLHATGWTVLYGVNLATSTPSAAAAEVAYATKWLGSSLEAIEIGNECDLYGRGWFQNWTLTEFEQLWGRFRTAILAATPSAVLAGPESADNIRNWTIPFGQHVGSQQISLLTQHYYRGGGQSSSSTFANLLSSDGQLVYDLARLKAGAASIGVPFRLAETNSYYSGGAPGVSDSYASALWVINHLFQIALGGGAGANLHGGGNSPGYTPIADTNGTVVEARPEYYGALLFTLAGQGMLLGTSVSVSGLNVTAYAVHSASGRLNIVVVNSDWKHNLNLSIDCGRKVRSAEMLVMTAPALDATSGVKIQGAAVEKDGSFAPLAPYTPAISGSKVSCYLSALTAALITID
jgi:hypothetical protein